MNFPFWMQHPTAHNLRFLCLYCLECRLQRLGNVKTSDWRQQLDTDGSLKLRWFPHNLLDVCWMLNEGVLCFLASQALKLGSLKLKGTYSLSRNMIVRVPDMCLFYEEHLEVNVMLVVWCCHNSLRFVTKLYVESKYAMRKK